MHTASSGIPHTPAAHTYATEHPAAAANAYSPLVARALRSPCDLIAGRPHPCPKCRPITLKAAAPALAKTTSFTSAVLVARFSKKLQQRAHVGEGFTSGRLAGSFEARAACVDPNSMLSQLDKT